MAYENFLFSRDGGVATITLNRPEQMNALDWDTVRELKRCVTELNADPAVRVIVITGKGRAFSAGADLEKFLNNLSGNPKDMRSFLRDFLQLNAAIERSSKAFIAAVNGYCLAGGVELMLACDLVIASDDARIGDAHLNYGLLPGSGGSQRLPRKIGVTRANWFFYTGQSVNGAEAERIGLVNMVVPADQLLAAATALATRIVEKSPAGTRGIKYLVNEGMQVNLRAGLELEVNYVHDYLSTCPDVTEGLMAFDQKRKPNFTST